jgi:GT2 family glycosyltransferase
MLAVGQAMPATAEGSSLKITVLIPNWNGMYWLDGCLKSLAQQDMNAFRTIVIDNGSTDNSVAFVEETYPEVEIVKLPHNTGFANAANVGFARTNTPYVVLLNSDTRAYRDWLSNLLAAIEACSDDVGAVNSQILCMDDPGRIDDAGDELSWYGIASKRGHNRPEAEYQMQTEIFSPCAGACLFRRELLLRTGGFDSSFFAYLEDIDIGLRGRLLGYRYIYTPKAKVLHKGHGASLPDAIYVKLITRNRLVLFAKNIPARLLLRHALKLLYGQLYFLLAYRRPWSSIKGFMLFVRALPQVISMRRDTLREKVLCITAINNLLHQRPPEPRLRAKLLSWLSFNV